MDFNARGGRVVPPPLPEKTIKKEKKRHTEFRLPSLKVEDVSLYQQGGYHPVNLGDVIGNRYRVTNKIGHTSSALIWLAWDLEAAQHVALRIKKSRSSSPSCEGLVLTFLRDTAPWLPITHLHQIITICGPNGRHQCLVLDLAGPSLCHMELHCRRQLPPPSSLKAAARDFTKGVADLHAAEMCHGRLTHENVLFQVKDMHMWSEEEVFRRLGRPKTEPLRLPNGWPAPACAPTHVVEAIDYSDLDLTELPFRLVMSDFSSAFSIHDPLADRFATHPFVAPEMFFHQDSPSHAAIDLWALGCLLFEIHTSNLLLPTGADTSEVLATIVETIGAFPESWRDLFRDPIGASPTCSEGAQDCWFDDSIEKTRPLDMRVRKQLPSLSKPEQDALIDLLERLLVIEPENRTLAREAWNHSWFKD